MPVEIDRDEVQRLMGEGTQLAETLPLEEFEDEHLPGAIHLPLRKVETDSERLLERGRPIVVYCWDSA